MDIEKLYRKLVELKQIEERIFGEDKLKSDVNDPKTVELVTEYNRLANSIPILSSEEVLELYRVFSKKLEEQRDKLKIGTLDVLRKFCSEKVYSELERSLIYFYKE